MDLNQDDLLLVEALCGGLPMVPRPYEDIGRRVGMTESQVIAGLRSLIDGGVIKRFGVIVQHRQLGYTANGMSVWNIPDEHVDEIGEQMGKFPYVTLCYQRPRQFPGWPYNLFAMVHGADRDTVRDQVQEIARVLALDNVKHDILFSTRQFKQCGARYDCKGRVDDELRALD